MKWSKIKELTESFLADSLKGRVQYHITRYARNSSTMSRAWITLDGKEIANFSNVEVMAGQSEFSRDQFCDALIECANSPIESSITSSNPLVQALAMFDKRCGTRRLNALAMAEFKSALARDFYNVRVAADRHSVASVED
jgi:hypothetical protein